METDQSNVAVGSALSRRRRSLPDSKWLRVFTWLIRLAVGGIFIFSGFVKGVDPWGTVYKVGEYLTVIGMEEWKSLSVAGVFLLCGYEFLTGIFLVFGSFRRSAPVMSAALMAFMLPLTLWIAISNPVADCGCFGDAWVLGNWATFWKNVALSVAIVWLLIYNRRCGWLITPALQWLAFVASAIFIVAIGIVGYVAQPLIDFRPYPVGSSLVEYAEANEASEDSTPQFVFIYEKDGVSREFAEDDELPDESEGWKFVERRDVTSASGEEHADATAVHGREFRVSDLEGEDITEEVLSPEGRYIMVLMPDMQEVSLSTAWVLNSMSGWSDKLGVTMLAVVAGSDKQIAEWDDMAMPAYPIYKSEDTSIKEIARGNPAVVYVIDNRIMWKNSLRAMDVDDFMDGDTPSDPMDLAPDTKSTLQRFSGLYISIMAVLVALSFSTKLRPGRLFGKVGLRRRRGIIDDDKVRPVE